MPVCRGPYRSGMSCVQLLGIVRQKSSSAPNAARCHAVGASSCEATWRGIGARCSHRGGPLQEGTFADDCVTCPWHQSKFRLEDGSIVDGPAIAPQPRYEVRAEGDSFAARRTL